MKKVIVMLVCLYAGSVNAGIIYDNGGASIGDGGNETTQWVQADDFNIASGGMVTGAGIYIGGSGGDPFSVWDGTLEYFLFSDAGVTPGSLITSGNGINVSTSDTGISWCCSGNAWLFEFDFESGFTAAAGTDYWLGVHLSNNYDRDELYWISQAGSSGDQSESSLGTFDNWGIGRLDRAYYLTGSAASVPEPASLVLLGLGLAGIGFSRKKKTA